MYLTIYSSLYLPIMILSIKIIFSCLSKNNINIAKYARGTEIYKINFISRPSFLFKMRDS